PSKVSARLRQTLHKATANRITNECEHNWNRASFLLQNCRHLIGAGNNYFRICARQFFCERARLLGIWSWPSIVNLDIATFYPAQILSSITKCVGASLGLLISLGVSHEYSEATHTFRLLCAHRKGLCDCPATNNFDEIAPPHHGPRRSGSDKVSVTAQINTLEGAELPQCPLWVKSRHVQCKTACPLWPQKRTCAVQLGMSALGQ